MKPPFQELAILYDSYDKYASVWLEQQYEFSCYYENTAEMVHLPFHTFEALYKWKEKYDIHISYALQAQVIAYVLFQRKVLNRKVKS